MLAGIQGGGDGNLTAVQETLIHGTGKAGPRRNLGSLGDGAVRLAPAGNTLAIAEGVETALSVMQLYSIPAWASLGAARMDRVRIPDDVAELRIFADADDPGRRAADRTAEAHHNSRRVEIVYPAGSKDWNDALMAEREARKAA
jgi:phage/plasmid primase-like uncharacterized protein